MHCKDLKFLFLLELFIVFLIGYLIYRNTSFEDTLKKVKENS